MEKSSVRIRPILSLAVLISLPVSAQDQPSEVCDRGDHLHQLQCLGKEIDLLSKELDSAYRQALTARPEKDALDARKDREQLQKSQLAWSKYTNENCALLGGLEGGSNLWVTDFASQCEKDEIQKRIEFLKKVANGEFGG